MSKSLFRLYDDEYMEVVRILDLEEIMCVVHDVILALANDRMRDVVSDTITEITGETPYCDTCGQNTTIRPGWKSLEAVKHAMDSAGIPTNGVQSREDRVEVFGDEAADAFDEAQTYMDTHLHAVAEIMEETGLPMALALGIYQQRRLDELDDVEDIDIPDDLGGFGWSS